MSQSTFQKIIEKETLTFLGLVSPSVSSTYMLCLLYLSPCARRCMYPKTGNILHYFAFLLFSPLVQMVITSDLNEMIQTPTWPGHLQSLLSNFPLYFSKACLWKAHLGLNQSPAENFQCLHFLNQIMSKYFHLVLKVLGDFPTSSFMTCLHISHTADTLCIHYSQITPCAFQFLNICLHCFFFLKYPSPHLKPHLSKFLSSYAISNANLSYLSA